MISGNRAAPAAAFTPEPGQFPDWSPCPAGSAVELDGGGTLTNVHIVGNPVSAKTGDNLASATAGLAVYDFSGAPKLARVIGSTISGNTSVASSATGTVAAQGGGVFNSSLLELRDTVVSHNLARAVGPSGVAEGGGIWNGVFLTGPPVELTLTDAPITRNVLAGGAGIERRGGGLFTTFPVTRTRTRIAANVPDQCFGCGAAAARSARAPRVPRLLRASYSNHRHL